MDYLARINIFSLKFHFLEVAVFLNLINNIKQKLLGWTYGKDPQKRSDNFHLSSLSPSILIVLECGCDD